MYHPKLTLLILALSLGAITSAVGQPDTLNLARFDAAFTPNGGLFQNGREPGGAHAINTDSNRTAFFAASLWLMQEQPQHGTSVSAHTYYNPLDTPYRYSSDYAAGPIAADTARYSEAAYQQRYQKVWLMSDSLIQYHRNNYQSPTYRLLNAIASWPAHGDTTEGEPFDLAPFADLNGDGVYQPAQGDFPKIRGDEAAFMIFNNQHRPYQHLSAPAQSTSIEIHLMAYGYNTLGDTARSSSLYLNYQVINRRSTGTQLDMIRAGHWLDYDLGNFEDDLMGSDSTRNLFYAYNADSFDEGPMGFGANAPAIGLVDLSASVVGGMYYHNSAVGNPITPTTDPSSPSDHENYLNFRWKDGTPLQVEAPQGDGYKQQIVSDSISHWPMNDAVG